MTMNIGEFSKEIVATVMGKPVTEGELHTAFRRVRDAAHWGQPIDTTVEIKDAFDRDLLEQAIIFFTGAMPMFTLVEGNKYRVQAKCEMP